MDGGLGKAYRRLHAHFLYITYCFSINHFAQLYARKVGIKVSILEKTLWGDFFLNAKSKRIFKGAQVCVDEIIDNITDIPVYY